MKVKIKPTCLLVFLCSCAFGQINQFGYKRELSGIKNEWHKIILPDEIFSKVSPDLSDIRIFGLTQNNDTIEAPYILHIAAEKNSQKDVAFNLVNQSKNDKGYYFTFELPGANSINQIALEFKQQNFDWRLTLEGSQNLKEWFSILEDYRILSIKNEFTDLQFTQVTFPDSRYHYFRLLIESEKNPGLISAKVSLNENMHGKFRYYKNYNVKVEEEKQSKQTIINMDMESPVPVCNLEIYVKDTFDFYRPVTIKYLTDSIKTEQGWKYNYSTLTSGTLNSLEKNEFKFTSTIVRKIKIIIENQDNKPLQMDSLVVKGYIHELMIRFIDPASYYIVYGNKRAAKTNYDIGRFADKTPEVLTALHFGDEQLIEKDTIQGIKPLFQNKIWLWTIMLLIIFLLGWFSLRMIKQK